MLFGRHRIDRPPYLAGVSAVPPTRGRAGCARVLPTNWTPPFWFRRLALSNCPTEPKVARAGQPTTHHCRCWLAAVAGRQPPRLTGPTPDSPTPSAGCFLGWGCCPFLPPPPTLPLFCLPRSNFFLFTAPPPCRIPPPRAARYLSGLFGIPTLRISLVSSLFCLVSTPSLPQISRHVEATEQPAASGVPDPGVGAAE